MFQNIKVEKHNPEYKVMFEQEKEALLDILKDEAVQCFHIGSTSVDGLAAKPIIDILLVVKCVENIDSYASAFESLNYEAMGEFGIPQRRYYRKGGLERTHQIHAFSYDNSNEIIRHLAFRDYLAQHPNDCKEYGQLKQELAIKHPHDIDAYSEGKDKLVKSIEQKALLWYWKTK